MGSPPFFVVRLFRQTPGDTGNRNIPLPPCNNVQEATEKAGAVLLAHRAVPNKPPAQMVPHHAQVIDQDENTLVTIQAVPDWKGKGETYEIVPAPRAA